MHYTQYAVEGMCCRDSRTIVQDTSYPMKQDHYPTTGRKHVVPIFKKGDRTNRENYRPVSLTSVPCKVMESIIKESLVKHLEANKLLCEEQHGFQRGRSCLTNLLETLESWTQALDDGYGLDVIFLDYRKAAIGKTQGIRYQGKSECMYRRLLGLEQQQSGSEEHFRIGRKL